MARIVINPTTRLWAGLPQTADDQAAAEAALRFVGAMAQKPVTKTEVLSWVTYNVARRHERYPSVYPHLLIEADKATKRAWDRLVAAGVIVWEPRHPLRWNL